ncbi:serine/threonine-protein kinase 33-like [Corticium candelabrum]|uniref:serine/threonine-protein kinase 33-like n=1 Tax=Corticium candelabrum TaxID=121492 RepID=UPI002E252730|nr:serine/threonine-protein kinase 33-like [Corticium candelabrum]
MSRPSSNSEKRARRLSLHPPPRTVKHTRLDDESQLERYYTVGQTLGQGSFGIVKKAVQLTSGLSWAVKIINKERAGSAAMHLLEREVLILKRVDHPHIVRLEEVFETSKKMFLVMELCDQGELKKVFLEKGHLTEDETRIVMKKLAEAVAYMHDRDMVHRDLKLENILLSSSQEDDTFNIKITDFGLSYVKGGTGLDESMMQSKCGTPLYMAPEVLENHDYSQGCDVWSMGVLMYILLNGLGKEQSDESKLYDQIQQGKLLFEGSNWKDVSSAAKSLIGDMLKVNPVDRLSVKEILDHPWISGKDEAAYKRLTVIDLMKEFRQEEEERADMVPKVAINGKTNEEGKGTGEKKSSKDTHKDQQKPNAKSSHSRPQSATTKSNATLKAGGSPKPKMRSVSDLHTAGTSGQRSSPGPNATTPTKTRPGYMQPTRSSSHAVEATKQRRDRDHTHKN